ncbi:8-oxo-dGTP diphosphatase [Catalinimonas alkaloidigena]|uniref:8-oxo-dGTP diphosphatase n=1 Tax=Catalinimonas alkaloidigena TaxID=1075417 RepID=A0A1G9AVN7_9BACT|nr:NUDIX hydrolase [Catalinimonas alkaloidigena]SDK31352.1 8-oxo-dGTP diphosphatase [Catalinimonas alkaloidigena]
MSYTYKYPRPAVTVDCLIFTYLPDEASLRVLLIQRKNPPFQDMWAFPGGFIEMDEPPLAAAHRELQEETGLTLPYLRQFHTFGKVDRDPRGRTISITYYGFVRPHDVTHLAAADDAAHLDWFDVRQLPELAFDHRDVFEEAWRQLQQRLRFFPVDRYLLPDTFTRAQLQTLYGIFLGEPPAAEAFVAWMAQTGLYPPTGQDETYHLHPETYVRTIEWGLDHPLPFRPL